MKKIRILAAEFRNFLSYGNNWQKFYFSNGLNTILGEITESGKSNGSGKSSITEVVPFALFGKTIKKINKADIVNWYNDKLCEVRLMFEVDDIPYEIRRGIKPNKAELYVEGSLQRKPAHVADFQAQIEEVIGMDFQTFKNLIYFSPNNTISIINAGKPEKRKFLESLFDLSIYSDMLKTANDKLRANDLRITTIRERISGNIREEVRLKQEIEDAVIPKVRRYRDKANGLKLQYDELVKVELTITKSDVDLYQSLLSDSKELLNEWSEKNRNSAATIKYTKKLIESLGDIGDLHNKLDELTVQRGNLVFNIEQATDDVRNALVDFTKQKKVVKLELEELVDAIQILNKDIGIALHHYAMVQDDIRQVKNGSLTEGECDACGQDITADYIEQQKNDKLRLLEKSLLGRKATVDALDTEMVKYTEQQDNLNDNIKIQTEDIESLERLIRLSDEAKKEDDHLLQRIDDLPDVRDLTKKHEEYSNIITTEVEKCLEHASKIHMVEIDIEQRTDTLEKKTKELTDRVKHEDNLAVLKDKLDQAVIYSDEIQVIHDKMVLEIEKKKVTVEELQDTISNDTKSIEKALTLTDYLNYLKVSLKDENVKRFAISSLIPYLNKQANHYLGESGFPYVVSIDAWLDVSIRGLGIEKVSYGSLSGGETKGIDIAVQLACNDIACMMAKASLNIMVLDEVLDSSVDSLGVQSLLDIVRVRQREKGDSVYIITHRNEIGEFTFDDVVRIIKEDGFSKLGIK